MLDALSRIHEPTPQLPTITVSHWDIFQKLKESFQEDTQLAKLIEKVQKDLEACPKFKVIRGILYFKGKLYIPSNSPLKSLILEEYHSSPLGGHSGIHKIYGRLQENVYWDGMMEDVIDFIKNYHIHQHTKTPNHLPYVLLQPLLISNVVWEDISLDFITELPSFLINTVILVVVDWFSKATHFGMLPTNFTVKVAYLFAKMINLQVTWYAKEHNF